MVKSNNNRTYNWVAFLCYLSLSCSVLAQTEPESAIPKESDERGMIDELNALVASSQPEGENGWPLLMQAFEKHRAIILEFKEREAGKRHAFLDDGAPDYERILRVGGTEADNEREREALARMEHDGIVDMLREAVAHPRLIRGFDETKPMVFQTFPWLSYSRETVFAMVARAQVAAGEGEWETVVDSYQIASRIGRVMSLQGLNLMYLVGGNEQTLVCNSLIVMLGERELPDSVLQRIYQSIVRDEIAPVSIGLAGEKIALEDFVDRVYHNDGDGDGAIDLFAFAELNGSVPELEGMEDMHDPLKLFASRREVFDKIDEYFAPALAAAEHEYFDRPPIEFDEDEFFDSLGQRHFVLELTLPAIWAPVTRSGNIQTIQRCTLVRIAVERFRRSHGELPESLHELVPEFLASVPIDPFDGKPLRYKRTTADEHGRPYLVYSVGADGVDNLGREPGGSPYLAFSKYDGDGFDFVSNQPRSVCFPALLD